ncbi:putative ATP synthase YscN [Stieleria bergensis]|uniref:Putative ATP synthase YscN n=1 Tax=Stieleria bergensis TaxID=2528025 RepID=A0A517STQ6_9BACT|nr:putative ATP synthase YscN [Planctomycetes bacterium SV_7m_r]
MSTIDHELTTGWSTEIPATNSHEPPPWLRRTGRLQSVEGTMCATIDARLGELVEVYAARNQKVLAEVIGFTDDKAQLMPYQTGVDFQRGNVVVATGNRIRVPAGWGMLGRVVDALGRPIDSKGPLQIENSVNLVFKTPHPLQRPMIRKPFVTGVRSIDGMLTLGQGQRVGLFAGSGVGKSTLLGEIAKYAVCDVNVVAMIGERGRELRPLIEDTLGPQGLARSVVVVSTSDQTPLARVRASETAVAIASWFRDQQKNVLFMLDSLTRLAHAQRELGLLLGEPPTARGYTPSVFAKMAQLLEQLGTNDAGVITGLLTILVDGDDMNEPVSDAARAILDGHIILDRKLAHQGHFPAVNVLNSASRLFQEVTSNEHQAAASNIRRALANYSEIEDLLQIGAYQKGNLPETDRAIAIHPELNRFLRQAMNSPSDFQSTMNELQRLQQMITKPL